MGPLQGLKILDFSTLLPGPYATMTLADLGAEVLHVSSRHKYDMTAERPPLIAGASVTPAGAWLGRNKKTMHLNLKKPASVEAVKKLIGEYDIVIEQFRPGVMKRLGLDYDTLSAINPGLIYCSLTGYGQTGPLHTRAAHDINFLARSGVMGASGRKDSGPVLMNMQLGDIAGGAQNAVIAILAAAYNRTRTGKGEYIDISMVDGLMALHTMDGARYLAGASAPQRESSELNGGELYDFYETSDGGYLSVAPLEPKFFSETCKLLGLPEWSDGEILKTDMKLVKDTFRKIIAGKTYAEWSAVLAGHDVCIEPVLSLEDAVEAEQTKARGMIAEIDLPESGGQKVRQIACPIHLKENPIQYRHAGYPRGWHTQQILEKLGYTDEQIADMSD